MNKPFNVFATQNPIEQEGTYSLPEAQLDRFMFQITVDYPATDEELMIISNRNIDEDFKIKKGVVSKENILKMQKIVREATVASNIERMIINILKNTRPSMTQIKGVKEFIKWGASPRAGIFLMAAAKAKALIDGRLTPDKSDIEYIAPLVLSHRLILSFKGEMENIKKEELIDEIVKNSN